MQNEIGFTVNFQRALEDNSFSSLTKSTIRRIQKSTYLPLATFLETISSPDLEYIVTILEKNTLGEVPEDASLDNPLTDLIILNEVLMAGDGYTSTGIEESIGTFDYFMFVCICESLKRKGLVTIDYKKIAYGSDFRADEVCKVVK